MLNVCFCFSDTPDGGYYRHPLVTMISIFEHTKSRVRVHLFADEHLTDDKKTMFAEVASRYGQEARFYPMRDIPAETLERIPPSFGKGSVYRLFIPDFVDADLALYLDCDVIVTLDIAELFARDMDGKALAGVHDTGQSTDPENAAYLRGLGIAPENYFYSGMLLMNCARLRERHASLKEAVFSIIAGHGLRYPDQDALNRYFADCPDEALLLPERFNFVTGIGDRAFLPLPEYENKIVHYTSGKAWDTLFPASLLYWKYFCYYFPTQEAFARMATSRDHKFLYLYRFLLRHPGVRRRLNRVLEIMEQGLGEFVLDRVFPSRKRQKRRAARQGGAAYEECRRDRS
jgi:lipopolysaccharide biosynthesis glycosyltransferase